MVPYCRIPSRFATRSKVSSAWSSWRLRVFAGEDGADASLAFGHGGEGDAGGHDALVEERAAELHRRAAFAHDDGRDGRLGGRRGDAADVEARALEFALEVAGVRPQPLDALRLLLQNVEGGDAGGRDRRRMRGGEEKRPGAVVEVVDQVAAAADVAAQRADGFRERAHLHVHLAVHAKMIDRPAAVAAQHARGVGVVDHHDGAVLFGQRRRACRPGRCRRPSRRRRR